MPDYIWFRDHNKIQRDSKGLIVESRKWTRLKVLRVTRTHYHVEKHWGPSGKWIERVPKSDYPGCYAMSEKEKEDKIFRLENAHAIAEKVRYLPAETLRKVAKLIGH